MKHVWLCLLIMSVVTLSLGGSAAAQQRQHMMGGMMGGQGERMGMRMGERLNLTDEQKDQVRQIFTDARKKNIDVNAKLQLAQIELRELITSDAPDQKKIDAKITALSQLHEAKMRTRIESMLSVQKLLTPEQRKKARDLAPFGRFPGGRHGGFGGGMGHMGALGPMDSMDWSDGGAGMASPDDWF